MASQLVQVTDGAVVEFLPAIWVFEKHFHAKGDVVVQALVRTRLHALRCE